LGVFQDYDEIDTVDASTLRVMKAKLYDQNEALTDQQILLESMAGPKRAARRPHCTGGPLYLSFRWLQVDRRSSPEPLQ
jgi:hypothetical protein